jgi:hypothetical protein
MLVRMSEPSGAGRDTPSDAPPLGDRDIDWPADWDAQRRVESIAGSLREPRAAAWVAERADVDPKTARKYLERLVDYGHLARRRPGDGNATLYAPDSEQQILERVRDLADRDPDEIAALREELADEIDDWRAAFGVDDPDELRNSIDEELDADERRRRRNVAYEWEANQYTLSLLEVALAFRRHRESYGTTGQGDAEAPTGSGLDRR